MNPRLCTTCNSEYQPTGSAQKYCGDDCKPRCHCGRTVLAKDLCPTHYSQVWRAHHPGYRGDRSGETAAYRARLTPAQLEEIRRKDRERHRKARASNARANTPQGGEPDPISTVVYGRTALSPQSGKFQEGEMTDREKTEGDRP